MTPPGIEPPSVPPRYLHSTKKDTRGAIKKKRRHQHVFFHREYGSFWKEGGLCVPVKLHRGHIQKIP